MELMIIIGVAVLLLILTFVGILSRYRKCPSDKILVIHGKTGGGKTAKCIHGGAAFVWPIIQGYSYMSLEPLQFECNLTKALSAQNIRVDVPTTVTVGISTEPVIMQNAAERILGLNSKALEDLVKDIVYGQLRLVVSNMTIEQLNADRDEFMKEVSTAVGGELAKIGLKLINLNITDIRDEKGYIVALGEKDAATAINNAQVEIARAERDGATRKAEQIKIKNSEVAKTQQEEAISVATANAERDAKVAEQQKLRDIEVASNQAQGQIGQIEADKTVAEKDAELRVVKANAARKAETARVEAEAAVNEANELAQVKVVQAEAKVKQEQELAQKIAEEARAERNEAALKADKIIPAQIEKDEARLRAEAYKVEIETRAQAEAKRVETVAKGNSEAEALEGEGKARAIKAEGLAKAEVIERQGLAEAEAKKKSLLAEAEGFEAMVKVAEDNPQIAIQYKMVEQWKAIAGEQVKAFENIKLGNVTVMDTNGGGTMTNVMKNLISTVAPSLDVMKGMNIPYISKALRKGDEEIEFPEVK